MMANHKGGPRAALAALCAALLLGAGCAGASNPPPGSGEPEAEAGSGEAASAPTVGEDAPQEPAATPESAATPPADAPLPGSDWETGAPESRGVDSAQLAAIHEKIESSQMNAVVIIKDGVLIDEYYRESFDENSVFRLNSCTKSVSGALIGIAIEQGHLAGVDAKLSDFFPEISTGGDAQQQQITIRHLLEHTSGIAWPEQEFEQLTGSPDWVDHVLSLPMAAEPGTVFRYTTGGSHMLAAILQQATGETAHDFAVEHLLEPLGMDSVEWESDPQGITDGGNGIAMSLRDAAKFGQLYLDGGLWRGRQIVPRDWVETSTKAQSAGEYGSGEYGYQWWVRPFGRDSGYSGYYAMGWAGQFIFVVPELRLVTAVASRSTWSDYTGQVCMDDIIAACETA